MKRALIFDPDPVSSAHIAGSFRDVGYEIVGCTIYDDAVHRASTGVYKSVACHLHDIEEIQLLTRLRALQPSAMMFVFSTPEIFASDALVFGRDADSISVYRGPTSEIAAALR